MIRSIFAILIFWNLAFATAAQDTAVHPVKKDLKIGLVLSGGGAKAMAQIGALKVIEEAGITIDYISGSSMGAIIGALYALGYSAEEIEKYLSEVDWDALLANEIPRNRLSYFDRKSESRYLLTFPVIDNKVQLPTGLNYAQYILKELSFLVQQSYRYDRFDEFPIPFVCVATNLMTGESETFEKGRLADALRASSAFPSLFTPYEINGKLYVDGGVTNNFPVQVLQEKGMDYIIGVDVQEFPPDKGHFTTVIRILEHISTLVSSRAYAAQIDSVDLLIQPHMPEAGVTTFDIFDSIVASGEKAARQHQDELEQLARRDTSVSADTLKVQATPLPCIYVRKINITGNENSTDEFILSKLRINKRDSCHIQQLDRGIDQLYGTRYFENVDYTISALDSGGYQLNIHVNESPSLAQFRVGLHYDDDFKTALLLNYTRRNLFFKNSRFSFDLAAGDNPRVFLSYFVDRGVFPTVGLKFRAHRFETRVYQQREAVNQLVYLDYSVDLFTQSTLYDALAIGGGAQLEGIDLSQDLSIGSDEIDQNSDFINYYGFIDFDSFNHAYFPTNGTQFSTKMRIIARHEELGHFFLPSSVIDFNYSQVIPLGRRVNMIARTFGATTIGPDLEYPYNIFLGSLGRNYINYIYPFIGYRYMELIGRNALVVRADFHFEIFKKHYILLRGNIGKLESTFDGLFGSDVLLDGYSLGYSFDSPVGPLEFNVMGSTNHSDIYTYISLGFWF